ncbi:hypothetical protein Aab01nite_37580 [Paractinoplanes abujensis]|uniref:Putative restriction endonuclease domain-containing protein n=1 Tax=Paractinoplanes abujensis TaxID=882441 RepID=A0A7W7CTX3_9ACTN|nr:Uma2 family endonuclease [Actinoplanes abujensis]MBB4694618.1 hypothetical protein [Actinoplanes abujensis]GID20168.1 hypothetical protein Aab01nite_37580 [Actinoplanes abujensis]
MSAETVGVHMPAMVTLDDLAAMNASDPNGHRYETSPEGVLSVRPPTDSEHAQLASRFSHGCSGPAGRPSRYRRLPVSACRAQVGRGPNPGYQRVGKTPSRAVWLSVADLLLVVEIVSPGSEAMDEVTKRREYATAGIPQYWVVDRDDAQTLPMPNARRCHWLGCCRPAPETTSAEPHAFRLTDAADHGVQASASRRRPSSTVITGR